MSHNGHVVAICIGRAAGAPMEAVDEVRAIAGAGLEGDRYCRGEGSFNKGNPGRRQVTLINDLFIMGRHALGGGFDHLETRRNIVTAGVELMWLIGREFTIGEARMRGVKYCDPCQRPNTLAGKKLSFKVAFEDRGGLVAEILEGGLIRTGSPIIPPPKGY